MSVAEEDLINQARAGDMHAFAEIYRTHAGMVYGVAFRMLGRREDAEEVVQDVFVAAHRALNEFEGQARLKTWLYRITVNRALNMIRSRKKAEVAMPEDMDVEDGRQDVREMVEREHEEAKVQAVLEGVSADHRACLVLRTQQGLSYEEIAQALNININTVRSRLKRAREAAIQAAREKGIR